MPCEHEPDLTAITPADDASGIVDVPCLKCGRSGSVEIDPDEIQWGDDDDDEGVGA